MMFMKFSRFKAVSEFRLDLKAGCFVMERGIWVGAFIIVCIKLIDLHEWTIWNRRWVVVNLHGRFEHGDIDVSGHCSITCTSRVSHYLAIVWLPSPLLKYRASGASENECSTMQMCFFLFVNSIHHKLFSAQRYNIKARWSLFQGGSYGLYRGICYIARKIYSAINSV